MKVSKETIEKMAKDYPSCTQRELAEKYGYTLRQIKTITQKERFYLRIKKNDLYMQKIRMAVSKEAWTPQHRENHRKGILRARRIWKRKILAGEKTYRWPLKKLSTAGGRYKHKLVKKYGYIPTTDMAMLWYDDKTKRRLPEIVNYGAFTEEQITKKYHIHFERAQDE